MSEITKKLGEKSNSEVSRNLSRLAEQGFIQKESVSGRKYELTSFGKMSISIFAPLQFIFNHGNYFKNHRIDALPISLQRGIDALSQAEFIQGTGKIMGKMKEAVDMPSKELWLKIRNPFPFELKTHTLNMIIPPELAVQKDTGKMLREKFPIFNPRINSESSITLAISDMMHGMIFFPSILDNSPDFNCCFYVKDSTGIKYLKKIWDYFWETGKTPD
ncbi:MAG: hypothetical protein KAU48_01895 [Candidatus Thorarchaeota archaeon]|nr:hypothetical protein [Candidatus Thorarchaeota archaeon]